MPIQIGEAQWERMLSPDAYLGSMTRNADLMQSLNSEADAHLSDANRSRLAAAVGSRGGHVRAVAMTEDWCGDAVVNLPLLFAMGRAEAGLSVRVFRREMVPELRAAYESDGYDHIPVVSFLDADWNEIARFMERTADADARVGEWKNARPDLSRLEAEHEAGDRGARVQLTRIYGELLLEMADWYRAGLWEVAAGHFISLIQA